MSHQQFQGADYYGYYGFREAPFTLTPNPKFAYSSHSHERALQTILHALGRREGLITVTGDIGCGKTTLCRRLVPLLPPRTFLSLVLNPFLTADDLLKQVLEDYGLVSTEDLRRGSLSRATCHELARTLQEFLNTLAQIDGTAVLIVDEAQNLPLRTLEQIRLLSNFETPSAKLLQIILVGQRDLEPILGLEEMRQLNQRVSRRCRIEPLSSTETVAYVEHRLLTAAAPQTPGVRFTSGSLKAVWQLSCGVPRMINLLCDRTLEKGHEKDTTLMDRRLVLTAAQDLELPIPARLRYTPALPARSMILGSVAAAALIAVTGIGVLAARGGWTARWSAALGAVGTREPVPSPVPSPSPSPPPEAMREANAAPIGLSVSEVPPLESALPPTTIVEDAPSYELTVASFETATRARGVAEELVGQGHPARVSTSSSGRWQMVITGPYSSESEARDAKTTLERLGFSDIRIARSR